MTPEQRKAIEMAIVAFERIDAVYLSLPRFAEEAVEGLRQAIEQAQKQEPVAWMTEDSMNGVNVWLFKKTALKYESNPTPLYTSPPQHQPLTDEQNAKRWRWALIESPDWTYAVCKWNGEDWLPIKTEDDIKELDATIEAAHGIGEQK